MSITSVIRYVEAQDTSATDGSGKTGLVHSDFTAKVVYQGGTLTALTPETITTLGTYQAPTANTNIRIKELSNADPTKGIYEVHFHNDQVVSSRTKLWLFLTASGAKIRPLEMDLAVLTDVQADTDDIQNRLPAALTAGGFIKADVEEWRATAVSVPTVAGVPEVDVILLNGAAYNTPSIDVSGNVQATLADGVAHGGTLGSSTATLALSRINVTSQTSNTSAITTAGNGSGHGWISTGGSTGDGFRTRGGSSSGNGIDSRADGGGLGMYVVGVGNSGLRCDGGAFSHGLEARGDSGGGGAGLYLTGASNAGLYIATGAQFANTGNASALILAGSGTGHGLLAQSGSGATGNGIQATSIATNGSGLGLTSTGTGSGLLTDKITASGAVSLDAFNVADGIVTLNTLQGGTFDFAMFNAANGFVTLDNLDIINGSLLLSSVSIGNLDVPAGNLALSAVSIDGTDIRDHIQAGTYGGGAVWIDTTNGTAGTTPYVNGTQHTPVDSLADALVIATVTGLRDLYVMPGSSIQFESTTAQRTIGGSQYFLGFGGQDVTEVEIQNALGVFGTLGAGSSSVWLRDCVLGVIVCAGSTPHRFDNCVLTDTIALSTGDFRFAYCSGRTAATATLDFGSAVGDTVAVVGDWLGGELGIANLGQAGSDTLIITGSGKLTISNTCIGGTIELHGMWDIVDNSGGAVTVTGDWDVPGSVRWADDWEVGGNVSLGGAGANVLFRNLGVIEGTTFLGTVTATNADNDIQLGTTERSSIATAVWAAGTRTLTSFGTLVADVATAVWAAGSRTLTAFGFAVNLLSTGLDSIPTTPPTGPASSFREMVVQTWRRFFKKVVKTGTSSGSITTYADNGTTVVTTQTTTSAGNTDTQNAAT